MSILRDFRTREIDTFPGSDSRTEPRKSNRAQLAKNVHYELDYPRTRTGLVEFDVIDNVDTLTRSHGMGAPDKHYSFKHLITAAWSRFVALAKDVSNNVYLYYSTLDGPSVVGQTDVLVPSLNSTITNSISTVYGTRLYSVFTDDNGDAFPTQQGVVWNGSYTGSSIHVDPLFQAPLSTAVTVTPTEPTTGTVTAGDHKVALVYGTRNGHETKPTSYTTPVTASGGANLDITLSPAALPGGVWPDWVYYVKLAFTTVQNPELYYFIPGTPGIAYPTPGGSGTVTFTIDISDVVLSQASEATDWFSLASSADVGEVKFVDTYGDRIVYVSDDGDSDTHGPASGIWFSDVADPQRLAADRNLRFLPNKKPINGGIELNGVYYVFGPNWTYAFNETTDYPVTWFPAQEISGTVGIKYAGCVARNSTNSMLWVAHTSGLYTFNGQQYNNLPASYRNPVEWDRINWEAPAWCFKLIDDEVNEQVMFQVPLDAAVKPSHVLKWDYKRGFSRDHVRFSIDDYSDGEGALSPVMELVQNPGTSLVEVWILDAESNSLYRTKNTSDTTPFNDDGAGIDSVYRSEALSPVGPAPLKHGGTHFRLTGAGDAKINVYSYDQYRSKGVVTRDLDATQYGPFLILLGWHSETAYLEVSNNNTANAWWKLGSITHYYGDWLAQR